MLAFRHRHDDSTKHPWQQVHAAPADRAVGLELQLIELHHQRETADVEHIAAVDAEILVVIEELAEVDELQLLAAS